MVRDLTKPQLRKIITAAGTGPHAARDKALVCLAACTGMELRNVVEIMSDDFRPPPDDDDDDLLHYLPDHLFTAPDGVRPMSVLRARRIVARAFVAAGLPPQRAATRLREAFREHAVTIDWESFDPLEWLDNPEAAPEAPAQGEARGHDLLKTMECPQNPH